MSLREYLFRKRMSREKFALECGVCPRTIQMIITGKTDPKRSVVMKIIRASKGQVTIEDLIEPEFDKAVEDEI